MKHGKSKARQGGRSLLGSEARINGIEVLVIKLILWKAQSKREREGQVGREGEEAKDDEGGEIEESKKQGR